MLSVTQVIPSASSFRYGIESWKFDFWAYALITALHTNTNKFVHNKKVFTQTWSTEIVYFVFVLFCYSNKKWVNNPKTTFIKELKTFFFSDFSKFQSFVVNSGGLGVFFYKFIRLLRVVKRRALWSVSFYQITYTALHIKIFHCIKFKILSKIPHQWTILTTKFLS